ncbi:MAG: hypothetical protein ACPGED_05925 [Flavobacteriales bacterium]
MFVLSLLSVQLCAQQTFNVMEMYDRDTYFFDMDVFEDQIFVSGASYELPTDHHARAFIAKHNQEGDLETIRWFGDQESPIELFKKSLSVSDEGQILLAYHFWEGDTMVLELLELNEELETINSRQFNSPSLALVDESLAYSDIILQELEHSADGGIFLAYYYYSTIHLFHSDFKIEKLKEDLTTLWEYDSEEYAPNHLRGLQQAENGNIHIIESRTLNNLVKASCLVLDQYGDLVSQDFISNVTYPLYNPLDLVVFDNDIVLYGNLYNQPNTYTRKHLTKINSDLDVIWGSEPFFNPYFRGSVDKITSCGDYLYSTAELKSDSVFGTPGWDNHRMSVQKHNLDGDLIWYREFHMLGENHFEHHINEIQVDQNGFLVLAGDIRNYDEAIGASPFIYGWLMKLDDCGCLVPGCDPNCVPEPCVEEDQVFNETEKPFLLGSNPITQGNSIYIHLNEQAQESKATLKLINSLGQELDSFNIEDGNYTLIYPTTQLAIGSYFFTYVKNDEKIQTERFVVR